MAARKVEGLLDAGAHVTVISPDLVPELQIQADSGLFTYMERAYQDGDLEGVFLAIAATDETAVNHAVWAEAMRRGCLINVVDDPQHSTFILPAMLQRGDLSVAVSTGGGSPALARRLREHLEKIIGPEYGILAELMSELRPELLANFSPGSARLQAAFRVIESDILNIILTHGRDAALTYARQQLYQQS